MVNIYEAGPFEGRLEQWPVLATSGALEVRLAETELEIEQAQRLRYGVFYEEMGAIPSPQMRGALRDFDKYDEVCDHLLVVDRDAHNEDGQPLVVGTYRLTREKDAAKVGGFYTSSEFDLLPMISGMEKGTKYLELGRSCIVKGYRARPGTMQLLWKGLMAYVARFDIDVCADGCAAQGSDRRARRHPQPAGDAERLCARRLPHRRRRGDRPPILHHRRVHLFSAVGHRRPLQEPLRPGEVNLSEAFACASFFSRLA